jgi:hypothetical protein
MIHTRNYRPVSSDRRNVPLGIGLDTAVLHTTPLTAEQERLTCLVRRFPDPP